MMALASDGCGQLQTSYVAVAVVNGIPSIHTLAAAAYNDDNNNKKERNSVTRSHWRLFVFHFAQPFRLY